MADYCSNKLKLCSNDKQLIDRLAATASPIKPSLLKRVQSLLFRSTASDERVGLLEFCRPMPPELAATITNGWSGPTPEWHSWRDQMWGCAYEPAFESVERPSPNELTLIFETRYTPPLAALKHGAKEHGFEYRLLYCAKGSQFSGISTESGDEEYGFTLDAHPKDEGVPEELIAQFRLDDYYREYLEDN